MLDLFLASVIVGGATFGFLLIAELERWTVETQCQCPKFCPYHRAMMP